MKKMLMNLFANYVLKVAVASNGKCWHLCYSEKVPENFEDMINEIKNDSQ